MTKVYYIDPMFKEALEKVQPKDLAASEITVRLGTTWIPESDIETFLFELLDTSEYCREHNISMNAWISDYIFKTLKEAGKLDKPKDTETRDETDK